jgi:hypothetical protein
MFWRHIKCQSVIQLRHAPHTPQRYTVTATSSSAPSALRLPLLLLLPRTVTADENLKIRRVSFRPGGGDPREISRLPFPHCSLRPQAQPLAFSEARILCRLVAGYLSIRSVRGLLAGTMSTLPPYSTYRTDSKVSEHLCGSPCLLSCVCYGRISAYLSAFANGSFHSPGSRLTSFVDSGPSGYSCRVFRLRNRELPGGMHRSFRLSWTIYRRSPMVLVRPSSVLRLLVEFFPTDSSVRRLPTGYLWECNHEQKDYNCLIFLSKVPVRYR